MEAFKQFLQEKNTSIMSTNPKIALRQGWDNYVRFASTRPRLYAAMMGRLLEGAQIEAADQAYQLLKSNVQGVSDENQLAVSLETAVDLIWTSANSASLLHVTADIRKGPSPQPSVVNLIRESTMKLILKTDE